MRLDPLDFCSQLVEFAECLAACGFGGDGFADERCFGGAVTVGGFAESPVEVVAEGNRDLPRHPAGP